MFSPSYCSVFFSSNLFSKENPKSTSSPSCVMALPSSWTNQIPHHLYFFGYHSLLNSSMALTCSASPKLLLLRSVMTFSSCLIGISRSPFSLTSQQHLTFTVENASFPATLISLHLFSHSLLVFVLTCCCSF